MSSHTSKDRGDRFVRLLAAHEHRLGSFVLGLVPNWVDAEDIVQETKIRLWEQFDNYDEQKDFGTWARVIAHYQILAFRKRSAESRIQFSQNLVESLSKELAETDAESDARVVFLDMCVKKLTEWQRNLLRRCYAENRDSLQTVASQLGRTPGAVRQALLRIRRKLYGCIEQAQQREGKSS